MSYPAPVVTDGQSATISCVPASGSSFPVGTSTVACTAQDATRRTDCSFDVIVTPPPRISATRFLAFGNSITEGKTADCIRISGGAAAFDLTRYLDHVRIRPAVPPAFAYPGVFESLLASRYRSQTFLVANEGIGGERAVEPAARDRLRRVLTDHATEVLLLQEGVNDLHIDPSSEGIADLVEALRGMVRETKSRGVKVFLGTLLPERPGGCDAFQPDRIAPANEGLRAMAAAEGAVLVDLYQAFEGQLATLIGEDGLHPSNAGYEKIAETFFHAIQWHMEVPPAASPPATISPLP